MLYSLYSCQCSRMKIVFYEWSNSGTVGNVSNWGDKKTKKKILRDNFLQTLGVDLSRLVGTELILKNE